MKITFLTIFPKMFDCYINESILKRAQKKGLVKFNIVNIRDFVSNKHKTATPACATRKRCGQVDDKPYGGGPGMIMKIEPIYKALKSIKKGKKSKVILLSAKGKTFNQKTSEKFSKCGHLIFICGRYEGVDERVAKHLADEEVSIGNYVLTGGELPAMVIADAATRLIPNVIKPESLKEETFKKVDLKEYPQYTRPENFRGWKVPKILLGGNHKKINEWRKKHSQEV